MLFVAKMLKNVWVKMWFNDRLEGTPEGETLPEKVY